MLAPHALFGAAHVGDGALDGVVGGTIDEGFRVQIGG